MLASGCVQAGIWPCHLPPVLGPRPYLSGCRRPWQGNGHWSNMRCIRILFLERGTISAELYVAFRRNAVLHAVYHSWCPRDMVAAALIKSLQLVATLPHRTFRIRTGNGVDKGDYKHQMLNRRETGLSTDEFRRLSCPLHHCYYAICFLSIHPHNSSGGTSCYCTRALVCGNK